MTNTERPLARESKSEAGFALILALLTLVLLTTLGLSLSATTSTESQISLNHRWTEQARYNAEAGIEVGKKVLAQLPPGLLWSDLLPDVRAVPAAWNPNLTTLTFGAPAPTAKVTTAFDSEGRPIRNFEGYKCDSLGGGAGYGAVLQIPGGISYQYTSNVEGLPIGGAFTLWIRRPIEMIPGQSMARDYPGPDALILVSEGVAPYNGASMSNNFARRGSSKFVIETVLRRVGGSGTTGGGSVCEGRSGQAGGGPQNTGFTGCTTLTGTTITTALPTGSLTGTGVLK
ncbi:MAG: PilX N-terminal domain-containing pilus assembly protein [Vicinamibacteria bacterium]